MIGAMTKDAPKAENAREQFEAVARKLGCDEDEAAFEAKLRRIAKHKPMPADKDEPKNDKAPE